MNGNGGKGGPQQLAEFFASLAENPALYNDYLTNPLGALRAANISEDLISAVLAGDLHHLNKRFQEEFAQTIILGTIVRG